MATTFTGNSFGQFGAPVDPNPNAVISITNQNSGINNRLTWGTPAQGSFTSYVQYDGDTFSAETEGLFSLGELTYRNGSNYRLFNGDFPLNVSLVLNSPVTGQTNFDFLFNILNTPNRTGDPVQDGDRLRFSTGGLSRQSFTFDGKQYTLELFGFSSDEGNTLTNQFNSPEDSVATATLYGRIAPVVTSTIIQDYDLLFTFRSVTTVIAIGYINANFYDCSDAGETIEISNLLDAGEYQGGVRGLAGNDRIFGTFEDDVVNGGSGADFLVGYNGVDYLVGDDDNDQVFGGQSNDILNGNMADDFVSGDEGEDYVRGGKGNDMVTGGQGNDFLFGDFGLDTLTGEQGADSYILRRDVAVGKFDITSVCRIADFDLLEGDRIGLTEGLTEADLSFEDIDIDLDGVSDTTIKVAATGEFIGVAMSVTSVSLQGSFFSVASDDPGLSLLS